MSREKAGYRDELESIKEQFGRECDTLTVGQVATYLGVTRQTVSKLTKRRINPLPSNNIGSGRKPVYRISAQQLARWRCG